MTQLVETKPYTIVVDPKRGPAISTSIGGLFYLSDPKPEDISITDIAASLSKICRFGGHQPKSDSIYTVAQHSLLVADIVSHKHKACALMHDATEAYIGDITAPLKTLIPNIKEIENKIWLASAAKFDLPEVQPPEVKEADMIAYISEANALLSKMDPKLKEFYNQFPYRKLDQSKILPILAQGEVYNRFIKRFELYFGEL